MAYDIQLKRSALNDLKNLGKAESSRIFIAIVEKPSKNPEQYEMLTGKFKGLRKFRVGDYRVIFAIREQTIIISKIAHRREVYD
jgi:mRNA interferase RelE/StbE